MLSNQSQILLNLIRYRYYNNYVHYPVNMCIRVILNVSIFNIPDYVIKELHDNDIAHSPVEMDGFPSCTLIWYEFRKDVPVFKKYRVLKHRGLVEYLPLTKSFI